MSIFNNVRIPKKGANTRANPTSPNPTKLPSGMQQLDIPKSEFDSKRNLDESNLPTAPFFQFVNKDGRISASPFQAKEILRLDVNPDYTYRELFYTCQVNTTGAGTDWIVENEMQFILNNTIVATLPLVSGQDPGNTILQESAVNFFASGAAFGSQNIIRAIYAKTFAGATDNQALVGNKIRVRCDAIAVVLKSTKVTAPVAIANISYFLGCCSHNVSPGQ